jgi:hypothetical protein
MPILSILFALGSLHSGIDVPNPAELLKNSLDCFLVASSFIRVYEERKRASWYLYMEKNKI